jgi:MFS transporter, DHA1 family, multidrug resistance protein
MQKWRKNLYAVWLTQLISLIGFGFGLPFIPFYIQDLGITDPDALKFWTGLLAAGPGVAFAVMSPVWGFLADRYGKKLMLLRAMIGGVVVMIGLGLSRDITGVLIFRILQGVLTGTVASSAVLVASGTPDNRLSYALGFVSSSTFIGYSLGPAAGGLIAERFGYRMSFFIGAGILFIGLLLVIFLIEEPTSELPEMQAEKKSSKIDEKQKILTPVILWLFCLFFFIKLTRTLPTPFLPLYVQELRGAIKGSARVTGFISGGIGVVSALSGLTLARLGDRFNRSALLTLLLGCGAVLSGLLFFTSSLMWLAVVLMLVFFFIGGVEPLLMSITSEKVTSGRRGALFGLQTMFGSLAWIVSPMMGSWISIAYSVRTIFLSFSILVLVTFIISAAVRKKTAG